MCGFRVLNCVHPSCLLRMSGVDHLMIYANLMGIEKFGFWMNLVCKWTFIINVKLSSIRFHILISKIPKSNSQRK